MPALRLAVNPDELDPDPITAMNIAQTLQLTELEVRTSNKRNILSVSDAELLELRIEAERRGLSFFALASPLFKWCDPSATPDREWSFGFPSRVSKEDRFAHVRRAFQVAEILGTEVIRIFSNLRVQGDGSPTLHQDPVLEFALAESRERGVQLLLENEPLCVAAGKDDVLDIVNTYQAQGLGIWLDLGNLFSTNPNCSVTEIVEDLLPTTGYVQLRDFTYDEQGRRLFCAIGRGVLPYSELLPALRKSYPDLTYGFETKIESGTAAAVAASRDYIEELLAPIDE